MVQKNTMAQMAASTTTSKPKQPVTSLAPSVEDKPLVEDKETTAGATTGTESKAPTSGSSASSSTTSGSGTGSTSIEDILSGMLDEGGAYLTQAKQQGKAEAARRGLSGSSIAAQAAQGAAIQAAAPLASQQAQLNTQKELAEKQIEANKELQLGEQEFAAGQAELDRLLNQQTLDKQIAEQQRAQLAQLEAARLEAEKNRDFEEAERLKALEAEKEAQLREIEARQAEQEKAIQAEKDRLSETVTQNLKGQYNTAVQNVLREAQISINAIETNANLKPEEKDKMINNILARQKTDINFINNLYNNMPEWNTDWTVLPPPIPPSGLTGKDKEEADKAYQDALDEWSNKWNPNYKPGETGDIKPPPSTDDGIDTTRPEDSGSGNDGLYEGDKGGR